jgi:hypothetical protein
MKTTQKPSKKLLLDPEMFNALYSTLLYFIATESSFGETQFSREAVKLKEQIDKYGRFIMCENSEDSTFIIYYFDKEVMQIIHLMILHNAMNSNPGEDHFTQLARHKKSKSEN